MNGITEGRIVHVVLSDNRHRAAMITDATNAETGDVGVSVFLAHCDEERFCFSQPNNVMALVNVPHDEKCSPHTWHWPERA